jgi:hypothetical protein
MNGNFTINQELDSFFSKQDKGYLYGEATSKGKCFYRYIAQAPSYMASNLPEDCIPADVRIDKNGIFTATFSNSNSSDDVKMKHKKKRDNQFIKNTFIKDMQRLEDLLFNSETPIIIVSDGGVHNYEGTFGLTISDGVRLFANNKGKLYSVDFFESSFRSEIYAMLAGLLTLEAICKEF